MSGIDKELLLELRQEFGEGGNLTHFLSDKRIQMTPSLIEYIYDLQSGSYTKWGLENPDLLEKQATEISQIIGDFVPANSILLDAGVGEGSTLVPILQNLDRPLEVIAVDISYSRLSWLKHLAIKKQLDLRMGVAELSDLPMQDNSVDCVLTVHSIEPNGGRESVIIKELARVSRKYLILIEPDWERADATQRQRMERLGYIRSLKPAFDSSGLRILKEIPISNFINVENKATAFILEKLVFEAPYVENLHHFVDPTYKETLFRYGTGLRNHFVLWFPILNEIPFLREIDAKFCISPKDETI